ncbi:kinase-like protein [Exidia glandulosa HHB12029]|uniref:Kinase-like protein n=1 Tax=Exidia glandulosa HHB12029 TaxID=1314781 RepID=A0A165FBB9_EXIGL|nr:kinase-like protein [Exidia glandulosa HHB12029]
MLYYPQQGRRMWLDQLPNFFGDAAVWLQLDHPHILRLLGSYAAPHLCYVVSRAAGGTCRDYLQAHPSTDILELALQVAEGLEYMHTRAPSIVHGDVRAHSVVVFADGNAALWNFDFRPEADPASGFDRTAFEHPSQNRWASPERLLFGEYNAPSDVWGFGMFMWELFSGRVPFDNLGGLGTKIFDAILDLHLPERPDHAQLDNAVWGIITSCWQRQPAARLCISEVVERIRSVLRQRTVPG